ncbi:MAG: ArsR/SmtB family transcription factor [Pseudoclavibacter sp.]
MFSLLGDPGRMRILLHLRDGGQTVGSLADAAGLSPSATSHALRVLRLHGIVRVERVGRHAHYELADAHVSQLLDVAREHLRHAPPDHSLDSTPE